MKSLRSEWALGVGNLVSVFLASSAPVPVLKEEARGRGKKTIAERKEGNAVNERATRMRLASRSPMRARPSGLWMTRVAATLAVLVELGGVVPHAVAAQVEAAGWVYPGRTWERVVPESRGYSGTALDSLHSFVKTLNTTGLMVVVGGEVVFESGDVEQVSYVASVRKSILAMLYGNYVADGTIRLDKTLLELGMTDNGELLPVELKATVQDLITARSGVYHPASNPGDNLADAPPRGSEEPGTYMLYSNWDFNAAGAVFERETGQNIYDALESDLAIPLGMRDFDRARHRKSGDSSLSEYLAYHIHLSTRDMARIGYLMLREGTWAGRQLVPADWVATISSVFTPREEMNPES